MSDKRSGTSGGASGTNGARRQRLAWLVLASLGFAAVQAFANVESSRSDLASAGVVERAAHVWIWELSSLAMWITLLPVIGVIVARARPPRLAWGWAALVHALATVPVSAVHVFGMVVIRIALYAAMGERYGFGTVGGRFLYEYRKDAATYLLLAAFMAFAQWLLARPEPVPGAPDALLVPDGNVTHRVPLAAIDWAASAGNYVEIAWGQRVLLHRSTLAALADELGPGFVRIHRGRLVRRAVIERIETDRSGDFTVTLVGGAQLRGSRRYRSALG